jgi:hypothetical protein
MSAAWHLLLRRHVGARRPRPRGVAACRGFVASNSRDQVHTVAAPALGDGAAGQLRRRDGTEGKPRTEAGEAWRAASAPGRPAEGNGEGWRYGSGLRAAQRRPWWRKGAGRRLSQGWRTLYGLLGATRCGEIRAAGQQAGSRRRGARAAAGSFKGCVRRRLGAPRLGSLVGQGAAPARPHAAAGWARAFGLRRRGPPYSARPRQCGSHPG